jgi:hypothetical protein
MKPKVSACIHHPDSNITTILTIDERCLIVLAYKPFMELVKSEGYLLTDIKSVLVRKVYPNKVVWKCQGFGILGILCLPLIQIPQIWVVLTMLSWFLLGSKALGVSEWGLRLSITKLDSKGKKFSFLRQIVSSPLKDDIESMKLVISSAVGMS